MHTVDAPTLKRWLDGGEAVLVDVREYGEYEAENIATSTLVPLASVSKNTLPDYAGKKLVMQCRSGRRSEVACHALLADIPGLDVYNLEGGILAWKQAGYPVAGTGNFFLALDRQVQLTVGLCLLLASALGLWLATPGGYWVTGFFGLGLTFSGLTGTCGLARLLAKMPWNKGNMLPSIVCTPK
ncbi:MAG: rhodanese-like domain-containing protein [Alphaproteobacteria bacterium]|nr:rhodanese-like domain-containing protein [Alphaproteobacteria bacterium]